MTEPGSVDDIMRPLGDHRDLVQGPETRAREAEATLRVAEQFIPVERIGEYRIAVWKAIAELRRSRT